MGHLWDGNRILHITKTVYSLRIVSPITGSRLPSSNCGIRGCSKHILYFLFGFIIGLFLYRIIRLSFACSIYTSRRGIQNQNSATVYSQKLHTIRDIENSKENSPLKNSLDTYLFRSKLLQINNDKSQLENSGVDLDSEDNFLFIGIMTARKFLDNRARASNMTWVSTVPGKVVYFLGDGLEYHGDLNVVILQGVKEDDYPPQKKSFAMIEYISKHFARNYKWIMRADDDVYVRVDALVAFLKSIDDRTLRYIGQPGFGNKMEQGKLGLSGAFCMGGPGVIMSSGLVQAVAPALKDCLKVTASGHEDTELGRCVAIATGVTCTISFQMRRLFYQNYRELGLPQSSFKKSLGRDELSALTLHPVKESVYVFKLDNFFAEHKIGLLELKKKNIIYYIRRMEDELGSDIKARFIDMIYDHIWRDTLLRNTSLYGVFGGGTWPHATNFDNIPLFPEGTTKIEAPATWDFVRNKRLYSTSIGMGKLEYATRHRRRASMHQNLVKEVNQIPEMRRAISLFDSSAYHRLSPLTGVEAILFVKQSSDHSNVHQALYTRKSIYRNSVQLHFREQEKAAMGKTDEKTDLYILMPICQRSAIYKRFLDVYTKAVAGYPGNVYLRVVVFYDDKGEHRLLSNLTSHILGKQRHLNITLNFLEGPFNRGKGMMAAQKSLPGNSLLLCMDVDMEFTAQFLHRVTRNTDIGRNAFFPVYFVNYDPVTACFHKNICQTLLRSEQSGLWRSFSYGIVSIYKRDLLRAGGYKEDIVGWGLEDVDFYEKCLTSELNVIRAPDPGLLHKYHPRSCDPSLSTLQLIQCKDSANAMFGSVQNLYWILQEFMQNHTAN